MEVQVGSSSSSRESSLKGLFEEFLQEHDEEHGAGTTSTHVQLQTYEMEQTISHSDSPFQYWAVNQVRFPTLAATAAKFLCAPGTSVDSERLFSTASNIVYKEKQARRRESRNAHFPEEELAFVIEIVSNTKFPQQCVTKFKLLKICIFSFWV